MWRPKDWKNPFPMVENDEGVLEYATYEAGADAMLEALRGSGVYMVVNENRILLVTPETMVYPIKCITEGTLVFIPDEEQE